MAWRHIAWLRGLHPEYADRIHLFKTWCEGKPDPAGMTTEDIPDPVGLPLEVHQQCLSEIERLLRLAAGQTGQTALTSTAVLPPGASTGRRPDRYLVELLVGPVGWVEHGLLPVAQGIESGRS